MIYSYVLSKDRVMKIKQKCKEPRSRIVSKGKKKQITEMKTYQNTINAEKEDERRDVADTNEMEEKRK